MKTIRTKILFMVLFFLAVVPFVMQAGLDRILGSEVLKIAVNSSCNFLKKHEIAIKVIGLSLFLYLGWKLVGKEIDKIKTGIKEKRRLKLERAVKTKRDDLLAKLDGKELINDSKNDPYRLTCLKIEWKQDVRNVLKDFAVPGSLVDKILILGQKYEKQYSSNPLQERTNGRTWVHGGITAAITLNAELFEKRFHWDKIYTIYHEAGHAAAYHFGIAKPNNKELNELIAECYALRAFVRNGYKDKLGDLSSSPNPYLNFEELVYYGNDVSLIQREGGEVDPLAYAGEIFHARQEKNYEKKVREAVDKLGVKRPVRRPVVSPLMASMSRFLDKSEKSGDCRVS